MLKEPKRPTLWLFICKKTPMNAVCVAKKKK